MIENLGQAKQKQNLVPFSEQFNQRNGTHCLNVRGRGIMKIFAVVALDPYTNDDRAVRYCTTKEVAENYLRRRGAHFDYKYKLWLDACEYPFRIREVEVLDEKEEV